MPMIFYILNSMEIILVYIVKSHWNVLKIYKFYVNLLNINLETKNGKEKN